MDKKMLSHVAKTDPEIAAIIEQETQRQENGLELIASENCVSRAVLETQGSVLTNKYAEGYPAKRYYGGCDFVDMAENLAIERAIALFQGRLCQCSTPFRFHRQYGSTHGCVGAWRLSPGNGSCSRRPSDSRQPCELLRKTL